MKRTEFAVGQHLVVKAAVVVEWIDKSGPAVVRSVGVSRWPFRPLPIIAPPAGVQEVCRHVLQVFELRVAVRPQMIDLHGFAPPDFVLV